MKGFLKLIRKSSSFPRSTTTLATIFVRARNFWNTILPSHRSCIPLISFVFDESTAFPPRNESDAYPSQYLQKVILYYELGTEFPIHPHSVRLFLRFLLKVSLLNTYPLNSVLYRCWPIPYSQRMFISSFFPIVPEPGLLLTRVLDSPKPEMRP